MEPRILTHANGQTMKNVRCICCKECKNPHDLKIQQARMKCLDKEKQVQCTGSVPGEMQEEHGQDSLHKAQSLHAPVLQTPSRVVQQWIEWPPAHNKSELQQLEDDVCEILKTTSKHEGDRRLWIMTTFIVSYISEIRPQGNREHQETL